MSEDSIFETQDGSHSILSHKFGVSYHSKYGAITESRHVFLEAGLLPKLMEKEQVNILEIGFGTGLNAFLTFLEIQERNVTVKYEAIEAYPVTKDQFRALNYPSILQRNDLFSFFVKLHESEWGVQHQMAPNFSFKKENMLFEDLNLNPQFDVIYFDAFAPSAQPELWEESLLEKMYQALLPGGVLVTYCAKGIVKRRLKAMGFKVERLPGPPGKREMTRGVKA